MKNQTKSEIIIAYESALKRMRFCRLNPRHKVLDNEAPEKNKETICASDMTYQLVPQYDHRRNITKRAIQFWKEHFIVVLSGAASTSPLHLWRQVTL